VVRKAFSQTFSVGILGNNLGETEIPTDAHNYRNLFRGWFGVVEIQISFLTELKHLTEVALGRIVSVATIETVPFAISIGKGLCDCLARTTDAVLLFFGNWSHRLLHVRRCPAVSGRFAVAQLVGDDHELVVVFVLRLFKLHLYTVQLGDLLKIFLGLGRQPERTGINVSK